MRPVLINIGPKHFLRHLLALLLCLSFSSPVVGEEVLVAVASNFLSPFKEISRNFQKSQTHAIRIVSGSTGSLFAQIVNGAPFHLFLSADSKRPKILEGKSLAVSGTRFVYAIGRLTLWSVDPGRIGKNGIDDLRRGGFKRLAIANPKTAPYGQAAASVLKKIKLWERLLPNLVRGGNIGQAFQFTATGNAELGFVSLSQILDPKLKTKGSRWDVPQDLHDVLEQSLALLDRGKDNKGALDLVKYLQGKEARQIITNYGYDLP